MRFSAFYICVILRGICCCKGPNFTSALLSCTVNTNAECLCPRCQPSPQPADIPANIPVDIPVDIPSVSWIRILKEEKVDIVKDLLHQWGWPFHRLVSEYLESENRHRGNRKKKKVGDLRVPLLEDKEI